MPERELRDRTKAGTRERPPERDRHQPTVLPTGSLRTIRGVPGNETSPEEGPSRQTVSSGHRLGGGPGGNPRYFPWNFWIVMNK